MLNKKVFLSFVALSALIFLPAVASSQQVDVKTGNTRTVVDEDGNVYLETNPSTYDFQIPSQVDNTSRSSNDTRTFSSGNSGNCRHDSYTYKNNDGGNSVYSRSSTTICQ
jgi:P pilus assembly chaperone PapD